MEYIIIRKDLFTQEYLKKHLAKCEESGLNVEEQIQKLIKSGYIKIKEQKKEVKANNVKRD